MGRVATDRDQGAVGPMLATMLGWACVTDVVELAIDGTKGTAKREADGGLEEFSFELPAVVTCQKDLNEPRYAGLKGIMAAKKKPLEETPADAPPSQTERLTTRDVNERLVSVSGLRAGGSGSKKVVLLALAAVIAGAIYFVVSGM